MQPPLEFGEEYLATLWRTLMRQLNVDVALGSNLAVTRISAGQKLVNQPRKTGTLGNRQAAMQNNATQHALYYALVRHSTSHRDCRHIPHKGEEKRLLRGVVAAGAGAG